MRGYVRGCHLEYSIQGKELGSNLYLKISTLESGFKMLLIRMPDSSDTCGRKPYPERKSCGFKTIRIRLDGAQETARGL